MPRVIRICGVGLDIKLGNVLRSLCTLSSHPNRPVHFEISQSDDADMYLFDPDEGSTAEIATTLVKSKKPLVVVAPKTGNCDISPHIVQRPVLASRLLARLDLASQPLVSAVPVSGAGQAQAAYTDSVLIVDDSTTIRTQVEQVLLARAVSPAMAATGEQALQLVSQFHFDLVLLDVVLPGIDGYQVCRTIKASDKDREAPAVVMLTGRSSPFDRIRGSMAGCDDYLIKPVLLSDLQKTLDKYLRARRNNEQAFQQAARPPVA